MKTYYFFLDGIYTKTGEKVYEPEKLYELINDCENRVIARLGSSVIVYYCDKIEVLTRKEALEFGL